MGRYNYQKRDGEIDAYLHYQTGVTWAASLNDAKLKSALRTASALKVKCDEDGTVQGLTKIAKDNVDIVLMLQSLHTANEAFKKDEMQKNQVQFFHPLKCIEARMKKRLGNHQELDAELYVVKVILPKLSSS